MTYCQRN